MIRESQKLMVRRIAGERGRGAGVLYCYGYTEIAALLSTTPLGAAKAVMDGALEPLSLAELGLARKQGLGWLRQQFADDTDIASQLRWSRPEVVSEVAAAHPPPSPAPVGLDTLWALTYADIAGQLDVSVTAVRQAGKRVPGRSLDIRSLNSILDYAAARHPLLCEAA